MTCIIGTVDDGARPIRALVFAGSFVLAISPVEASGTELEVPNGRNQGANTLFNPTPRGQMREMFTDRPDKTEGPFTVDAGHFQIEADILSYSHDRYNPDRTATEVETVRIAPVNLKAGICNAVDLQLLIEPYESTRTHDLAAGVVQKDRGRGDLQIRTKWNAWGNDGGATAFAVMPYVKFPAREGHAGPVEGGAILPFAVDLPAGWSLGAMTEFDLVHDVDGDGHHPEFVNSITLGHDIFGSLAGYAEFYSAVSAETGSDWVGTVDVGLTYRLTEDIQLDTGVNLGVTRTADDLNPFIGISWRF